MQIELLGYPGQDRPRLRYSELMESDGQPLCLVDLGPDFSVFASGWFPFLKSLEDLGVTGALPITICGETGFDRSSTDSVRYGYLQPDLAAYGVVVSERDTMPLEIKGAVVRYAQLIHWINTGVVPSEQEAAAGSLERAWDPLEYNRGDIHARLDSLRDMELKEGLGRMLAKAEDRYKDEPVNRAFLPLRHFRLEAQAEGLVDVLQEPVFIIDTGPRTYMWPDLNTRDLCVVAGRCEGQGLTSQHILNDGGSMVDIGLLEEAVVRDDLRLHIPDLRVFKVGWGRPVEAVAVRDRVYQPISSAFSTVWN